jgi:phosphoserine phosphatase
VTAGRRLGCLVIFDLDNTLADRARFFGEWAEAFVRKRHVDRQATLAGVEGEFTPTLVADTAADAMRLIVAADDLAWQA